MLITNAYGILALAIIFFILLNLNSFVHASSSPQESAWRAGVVVFLVGVVTERLGAKGRVFFLPVWLIGILLLGYACFVQWGLLGVLIPAMLMAILIAWWLGVCQKHDREMFERAKRSLAEWREQVDPLGSIFFWDYVQRSLFFPTSAHTREVCAHNQEVLHRVWQKLQHSEPAEGVTPWHEYQDFLTQVIQSDQKQQLDRKLQQKMIDEIQSRYLRDRDGLPTN